MIRDILQTLGFKDEEVKTYLALLESGPIGGGELAKAMNVPRPSVYGWLDRLVAGGLVIQSQRRGVKIFAPEPGDKIRFLYKRKIEELRAKEKALDEIIPKLAKRAGHARARPRMQFFEGRDEIETAYQDFLSYPGATNRTFWPLETIIGSTSEDFFRYLNKQRILSDIRIQAVWPHKHSIDMRRYPFMGTHPDLKREVRVAPAEIDTVMGYRIYANKVMFSSSRAENFCFIIESAELVQLMTMQHELLWNVSKTLATKAEDAKRFLEELYEMD